MAEMSIVSELLQYLEGFVELIETSIDSRDWDGLDSLLVNRQKALEQLCALSLSSSEREAAVTMMVQMQTIDRLFETEVQSQKEALQKQATLLAHDRKAIKAYQSE